MEEEELLGGNGAGINVSLFDYSVENHFKAMDTISKLCGEAETDSLQEDEIQRLSSSITFLREWSHFNYQPRVVRFACEMKNSQEKCFLGDTNLPQFSSATVPKNEGLHGDTASPESSKDFVMYVGGSVWALDWCPRFHERSACRIKCEFVAVAAHPPDSCYHKIGTLLMGRGLVQIWCILNVSEDEEEPPPLKKPKRGMHSSDSMGDKSGLIKRPKGRPRKKQIEESLSGKDTAENSFQFKRPRGRPRKQQIEKSPSDEAREENSTQFKRPRGRPRKKEINESLDSLDCNNQYVQALAIQYPEDSSQLLAIEGVSGCTQEQNIQKNKGKKQKTSTKSLSACNSAPETTGQSRRWKTKASAACKCADVMCPPLLTQNDDDQSSTTIHENSTQDPAVLNSSLDNVSWDKTSDSCSIPKDIALPRVVLCLAHNGKVAWDVKWQPCHASDSKCQHRMGYLAVLLGNGSLEVWDVPLPHIMKVIYSSSHREGTDPRFIKLEPVFRCSIAKRGEIQSIPLTVEWSTSCPHDYLLAGCHDGTVALWKFSASGSSGDTRPLLRFSADTVAIRAVAWAPVESTQESANVIVTAGHGGLKFWDIRDPFRPLWDLHPTPKFIYSLDWLPDPRCIILSFDDGTMRLLSLTKAAYDGHVNEKPTIGPKQQGMHILNSSSFAIWSVQVSRKTGMVAYCGADGIVSRFQLTSKAVEKEPSRHRAPHFMVGSLSKNESAITVNIPLLGAPLTLKKPFSVGDNPKSMWSLLEFNQTKRANDKKEKTAAENQRLALCHGNDLGMQSGFDETFAAFKSRTKPKSKNTSKKMAVEDLALVCTNEREDRREKDREKTEAANEIDVMPPKIVAMNRVRWNMNKGCERWLCSGGAAGIVRCQEIIFSDTDKYLASKR
ncbi:uncharacterized protein LOC110640094 isoform X3 [Hevea brasiliensis]|uniref:uncharacterized protein LOC110640094 isoform X3 n=2 Tax=Hevea brasiliensis TaxID=3981 RepID=UPI0025E0AA5F|nr:uncharacterized protein LOC110640094 isoform X3 [Hevea brasiliensis]